MIKGLKIFIWIVVFILLMWAMYYFLYLRKISMSQVKLLISKASAKYKQPANVEVLLLQGVVEIKDNPKALEQAFTYSKNSNIPIEQVLVDNAIAMAKSYGYIE